MNRITLLFLILLILTGCGVKGPPLPPMKIDDNSANVEKEKNEDKDKKEKKKINALLQY